MERSGVRDGRTSYQRALDAAAVREQQRRDECWRFWAGYRPATVGECQSSTEAAALVQIEAQARGRRRAPIPNMERGEERTAQVRKRGGYAWGGIGMVDIIAAWRVACAEHDAGRTLPHSDRARGSVDRVVQWG